MHWDFWNWELVKSSGDVKYYEHKRTGRRKCLHNFHPAGSYTPVDTHWVKTGEFVTMKDLLPPPSKVPKMPNVPEPKKKFCPRCGKLL